MLKGKNVFLRPVRRTDISFFLRWFNDPEVLQYLAGYLPMTEMAEEKWIEELASQAGSRVNFVIESAGESANQPIGTIGLHNINPKNQSAEFGIAIGEKEYWSKGYGSEATRLMIEYGFKQLNLHRISSSIFAFNERSLRMHIKVGFREEGRLRQADFKNGNFHDRIIFGLLRDEREITSNSNHAGING